jgi:hypothetical protein
MLRGRISKTRGGAWRRKTGRRAGAGEKRRLLASRSGGLTTWHGGGGEQKAGMAMSANEDNTA